MNEALLTALTSRYALPENAEWGTFLAHLDFSEGFALFVLLAPDDAGIELCRRALEQVFVEKGTPLQTLALSPGAPPEFLANALTHPPAAGIGALWIQLEEAPEPDQVYSSDPADAARIEAAAASFSDSLANARRQAWAGFLRALNPERNPLRRTLALPLIFAGPPWLQQIFREVAPDLWSIRRSVATIHPAEWIVEEWQKELRMPSVPSFAPADEEAKQRLGDLRHDLEVVRQKPGAELLRAELLRRLGVELTNLLEWPAAECALIESFEIQENHHAPLAESPRRLEDLGRCCRNEATSPRPALLRTSNGSRGSTFWFRAWEVRPRLLRSGDRAQAYG